MTDEELKTLTELDLSDFGFLTGKGIAGMFARCHGLTKATVSDTILNVNVQITEYEKAGWSDAHTPSQEWAYAREVVREVPLGWMSEYERARYLGLRIGAKLIIVPSGKTSAKAKQPEPKKDPLERMSPEERKTLTRLSMSGADTSGMRSMRRMFAGFESLKELELSSFDTRNAEDMEEMFLDCRRLSRM